MSTRLRALFGDSPRRPLVIPYLTAGYPRAQETLDLLAALEAGGADAIELGLPWSDPLADGPVIQAASLAALEAGINHGKILDLVRGFRARSEIPLVLMGYANPILAYGPARFFLEAGEAGADGILMPDVPLEEAGPYLAHAAAGGLDWIPLAAPTSSEARLRRIDALGAPFVYVVAVTGVTGVRDRLPVDLAETLSRARDTLTRPFVVGFGFSRADQIPLVCPPAGGVVVGSALIRAVAGAASPEARVRAAREFVEGFRDR